MSGGMWCYLVMVGVVQETVVAHLNIYSIFVLLGQVIF